MNAAMEDRRLIRIVHGERPDEALVDQVDALREAVVVRVDEERALDNQNVRKELSKEIRTSGKS